MPGIFGFTRRGRGEELDRAQGRRGLDMLVHEPFHQTDPLFLDEWVCAGRVHLGVINPAPQPWAGEDICVWADGEIHNGAELAGEIKPHGHDVAGTLGRLFLRDPNLGFLDRINGLFAAAIYEKKAGRVHLISDRYGLRHLYYTIVRGRLAWSSEVKSFLAIDGFEPVIDASAVHQFFAVGYLLGLRTWLKNVSLLPTGTVLTLDLRKGKIEKEYRYWWWDRIRPIRGRVDEEEAAEELGRLLHQAVALRCRETARAGVTLSGGLDSRAMLAGIPLPSSRIIALTFGRRGSADVRFAGRAAAVRGVRHLFVEISHANWLRPRLLGVWKTDGHLDLMHMHGIAADVLREHADVNVSGFAGDLIAGASYLEKPSWFDRSLRADELAGRLACRAEDLDDVEAHESVGKSDFYFLDNRVRRFTAEGTRLFLSSIEQAKPFFDNDLMEFVYSLPDSLRFNGRLYKRALLMRYPDFFKSIPWQKIGVPISWPEPTIRLVKLYNSLRYRLLHLSGWRNMDEYTDYPRWIREEPARQIFKELLLAPKSLYPEFIPRKTVEARLTEHWTGQNHAAFLCRAVTFEIWLQKVFSGTLRVNNCAGNA